jgi:cyclopropane fatty-acyl-phospholipid synthase-like methyltransferase
MLSLLEQGITCLPVHDSFIVPAHQWKELQAAMDSAFADEMFGHVAKRKNPTQFSSDFRMTFLPNGELDRQAMFEMHDSATHNKYVQSRRAEVKPVRRRKPSK